MARRRKKKTRRRTKRVRRKTKRRVKKKADYKKPLITIAIVAIATFLILNSLPIPQAQTDLNEIIPSIPPETQQTGGYCERDSECFLVGCRNSDVSECVNITEMENYYTNCRAYWDVKIENRDFSRCACIENSCMAP